MYQDPVQCQVPHTQTKQSQQSTAPSFVETVLIINQLQKKVTVLRKGLGAASPIAYETILRSIVQKAR